MPVALGCRPKPVEHQVGATLVAVMRLLSATIIIGAISGAVIGGLGGRPAMRILS